MELNKKEENKYESLASFLDDRLVDHERKHLTKDEDEELDKLIFLWDECHPEEVGTNGVWDKTLQKIKTNDASGKLVTPHRRSFTPWIWSAVASVVLILGFSYFFFQEEEKDNVLKMEQYVQANIAADDVKEVTLVVSNKKKIEIANNSQVAYSATGQVLVNADELDEAKSEEDEYNQIIVPKGRRTMILLADNSRIWINSGSKVLYPRSFGKGKRKIFVEGEAYLKVARDESRPFVVSTSDFEVEVLGTSFNVSAHKGSSEASVVLVEGAVDVKDSQERHVKMQPNERVQLNEAGISKKEKVNASEYIRWVDGIWVLNGEPLKEVIKHLVKYYGQLVHCDPVIENEPVYGKLYLNDDLDKVLESIIQTLPITYTLNKDVIYRDSI